MAGVVEVLLSGFKVGSPWAWPQAELCFCISGVVASIFPKPLAKIGPMIAVTLKVRKFVAPNVLRDAGGEGELCGCGLVWVCGHIIRSFAFNIRRSRLAMR